MKIKKILPVALLLGLAYAAWKYKPAEAATTTIEQQVQEVLQPTPALVEVINPVTQVVRTIQNALTPQQIEGEFQLNLRTQSDLQTQITYLGKKADTIRNIYFARGQTEAELQRQSPAFQSYTQGIEIAKAKIAALFARQKELSRMADAF